MWWVELLNSIVALLESGAGGGAGAYESIATVTVSAGGSSSVTFSSIPSTYVALQVRYMPRISTSDTAENTWLRFNGDTGSNYTYHFLDGNGSSASANGAVSQTRILAGRAGAANSGSNIFGVNILDIHDYASTSKYKTARILGGIDRNGDGNIRLDSGLWLNTAAITSLTILPTTANSFVEYSVFSLYGIKGA
jgi:hypothetical protein